MMNWKGFGRKGWPHRGNIPVFVKRGEEEPRKTSKAGVSPKI
jgi:hypothetical protein